MVNQEMIASGLFIAHKNDCDSTEVFVQVGSHANRGFCIEKNERASAQWDVARQDCASDDKRLPEPSEFKIACDAAPAGLNNMTDNLEWISNFTLAFVDYWYGSGMQKITAWLGGNGSCSNSQSSLVSDITSAAPGSYTYRCIR